MTDADTAATAKTPQVWWRPYQIYMIVVLVLITVSSYMDRSIMGLLQEVIKRDLGLSDWQIGLISGPAFALFHSIVGVPMARLAERINRPRLLSISIVVWSGATALCGAAGNFLTLALCRMGVGMGEGGANPISHALVADTFTAKQRGFAMSVLSSGASIGGILAPLIGGVVAYHWGWRAAFVAVGLPGLALAVLAWFTLKETRAPRTADAPAHTSFATDLKWLFVENKAFRWVFAAGAFNGVAIQGIGIFTGSFLMRTLHMNVAEVGGMLGLRGGMGLIGTIIGGYLADRFADPNGRSYVLVPAAGAALSFVLFLIAFTVPTGPLVVVGLMGAVIATELKAGPNFAAVQNIVPSRMRATATAMFFLGATVVGTTLGAATVGGVSDIVAARLFPAALGEYAAFCPGGHAAARALAPVVQACAASSAEGLRVALIAIAFAFLGAMTCFYVASRAIRINTD